VLREASTLIQRQEFAAAVERLGAARAAATPAPAPPVAPAPAPAPAPAAPAPAPISEGRPGAGRGLQAARSAGAAVSEGLPPATAQSVQSGEAADVRVAAINRSLSRAPALSVFCPCFCFCFCLCLCLCLCLGRFLSLSRCLALALALALTLALTLALALALCCPLPLSQPTEIRRGDRTAHSYLYTQNPELGKGRGRKVAYDGGILHRFVSRLNQA
jgi:hypothetical protein